MRTTRLNSFGGGGAAAAVAASSEEEAAASRSSFSFAILSKTILRDSLGTIAGRSRTNSFFVLSITDPDDQKPAFDGER